MQITVKAIETSQAEEAARSSEVMLTNAQTMTVTNQPEYEHAAEFLKIIKGKIVELEEMRKVITKPLDAAKRAVMDLFRDPAEKLAKAEMCAKNAMLTHIRRQDAAQAEEQRRAQAEADRKRKELDEKASAARAAGKDAQAEKYEAKAEAVVAPVVAPSFEPVRGVSVKTLWRARVRNVDAVPREFLIVNDEALQKIAQATKGAFVIPGVEFYSEDIMAAARGNGK